MTGETLFFDVGCGDCHMVGFQTDDEAPEKPLRARTVNAYTDFLVHDMGFNGDLIEQGQAGLTEMRTTPLWGLRIRDPLWHDGRIAGGTFDFRIFNAVLNHDTGGSEAQASAQAYLALSVSDQNAIIAFLDSLGRREFDMDGDGDVDGGDVLVIDDCFTVGGPFSPDDHCAIADPDQSGFVDQADLDLLAVVLGLVDDTDEESDDSPAEDPGPPNGDDDDSIGNPNQGDIQTADNDGGIEDGTDDDSTAAGMKNERNSSSDYSMHGNAPAAEPPQTRMKASRRESSRRGM
jgi:hypothetical protein